jgi:hypothetical protein
VKKFRTTLVISAAFTLSLSAATFDNTATTLDQLTGPNSGNTFQVGDKIFSDFTWSYTCSDLSLCTGYTPSQITVTPFDVNGELGFSLGTSLSVSSNTAGENVTLDATLDYEGATVSGQPLISDVLLEASSTIKPTGSTGAPGITIGETVSNPSNLGQQYATLTVFNPPPVLTDMAIINPTVSAVFVQKDIDLQSGTGCNNGTTYESCTTPGAVVDFANVTTITQALSQVPEPSFYGILAVALAGLFWTIRREKRQPKQVN